MVDVARKAGVGTVVGAEEVRGAGGAVTSGRAASADQGVGWGVGELIRGQMTQVSFWQRNAKTPRGLKADEAAAHLW